MSSICVGKTISIAYTIKNEDGQIIDTSGDNPWVFVHGEGQMVRGVERSLLGHTAGDSLEVTVAPEDAYGLRDISLTSYADLEQFDDIRMLRPGMALLAEVDGEKVLATVKELKEDKVLLDMNHPFAGQTLHFSIDILSVV